MDRRRGLVGVLLIGLLVGQFVHYGAVAHEHDRSPSTAELSTDYSEHVGEELYRWARVTEVRAESVRVRSGPLEFTLTERIPSVERGDSVQIYGRVAPDHRIVPIKVIVSDSNGLRGLYLISAVGLLLTGWLFVKSWTVNWNSWTITPNGDGG